ncbi:MAG: HD-GYP domain-containing protein [Desulfobacterota bacterium]|nr:HD-GYP domain-containing protein [Thermodesulfobacteriota bacterium]
MSEKIFTSQEDLPTQRATDFVVRFFRVLKGTAIYERNNLVMEQYLQDCLPLINSVIQSEGYLSFKIVRENCFFNHAKVQMKAHLYPIFREFMNTLRKRWIGEISFDGTVKKEELGDFAYLLSGLEEQNEGNYLYVRRQLQHWGFGHIHVEKLEWFRDEEIYIDSEDQKRRSREVYFKSVHLVKEVMEGIKNQRVVNLRKAKRLMQNAVNIMLQDESTLLGLANIKNYDEYTFNHSVNVALYAIALGQRLGLPKKHLSHLGMAGLFHDIGKTRIPKEILNKEGKLTPEEWETIRTHPVVGAEIVMAMKEWGDLFTRMLSGAFEHHLRYDLNGYPKLTEKKRVSLFGRIITLADFFDALGRPRVYNRFPYVSEKILGLMMERRGKEFDPILVKVFVNLMGLFPLGTLVLLDTNEMGIVVKAQEDPELIDRPKVNLLYYQDGAYRKGKVIDLAERDEKTGQFKWTIIKTLDPNDYHINIAEFVI